MSRMRVHRSKKLLQTKKVAFTTGMGRVVVFRTKIRKRRRVK